VKRNMEVHDRLGEATSKMDFIEFALSFMSEQTLIGTEQICGLAYILRDIKGAMGGALTCAFYDEEQAEKAELA